MRPLRVLSPFGASQNTYTMNSLAELVVPLMRPSLVLHPPKHQHRGENTAICSFSVNSVQKWKVLAFRVALSQGFYSYKSS